MLKCEGIGIDFGTNYSRVCVFKNRKIENLVFAGGVTDFPSIVAFTNDECLVGRDAEAQAGQNSANTVFCMKRFIGQKSSTTDPRVEKKFPDVNFKIDINGKSMAVYPQELVAILLQRMKLTAENYLGHKVKLAVISVPSSFNSYQRKEVCEAAARAGFEKTELINETTAAAIYHRSRTGSGTAPKNYMVVSVGGGSFDVSIVSIDKNEIEVKTTSGDKDLGGLDFDQRLMNYVINGLRSSTLHHLHSSITPHAVRKIALACERAKIKLSTENLAVMKLDEVSSGLRVQIWRKDFESLCRDLFEKIKKTIENVIVQANLGTTFQDIVLVGGSTKIPIFQHLLPHYTQKLCYIPDSSVAHGAMIQAMTITKNVSVPIKNLKIKEVSSNSYSVKSGDRYEEIMSPNTPLSSEVVRVFDAVSPDGCLASIEVMNENKTSQQCVIEKFVVSGNIAPGKNATSIKVFFSFDKNGILVIRAGAEVCDGEIDLRVNPEAKKYSLSYSHLDLEWRGNRGALKKGQVLKSIEIPIMHETKTSRVHNPIPNDEVMSSTSSFPETKLWDEPTTTTKSSPVTKKPSSKIRHVIGIDLGTTYSLVGVYQNGEVNIIKNEVSKRKTPSAVSFTDLEFLIGGDALKHGFRNAKNVVLNAKQFMGKRFADKKVASNAKYMAYDIGKKNDEPYFEVEYRNEKKQFSPEEISAMVIRKMLKMAENHIGDEVKEAVITVPSHFNDGQRQATRDAATIAGLNTVHLVNETTAAAIAYGFANSVAGRKNVLFYHMGGGTCDVSVVSITDGTDFEVKATVGDTDFGGADFDKTMMKHFAEKLHSQHSINILYDKKRLHRLREVCDETKKKLSLLPDVQLEIDFLGDGESHHISFSREKFEEICEDLFEQSINLVKRVLIDAKLEETDIDEIVLVGGSTRIPKIQSDLRNLFHGKEFKQSINTDEAAIEGATLIAGKLSGLADTRLKTVRHQDVAPFSIEFKSGKGAWKELVPQNSATQHSFQNVGFTNRILELFETNTGISKRQKLGEIEIEANANFEIDENGILTVFIMDLTGTRKFLPIKTVRNQFSKQDIETITENARRNEKQNEEHFSICEAKNELEDYMLKARRFYEASKLKMNAYELSNAECKFSEATECMKSPNIDKTIIAQSLTELESFFRPLMIKYQ